MDRCLGCKQESEYLHEGYCEICLAEAEYWGFCEECLEPLDASAIEGCCVVCWHESMLDDEEHESPFQGFWGD